MVYMSKPIKVSDDTYKKLKQAADANFRSLGGHIDYLMTLDARGVSGEVGKISTPQIKPVAPNPEVSDLFQKKSEDIRTKGDILARIRVLEAKRDEELKYNQDADYAKAIDREYTQRIAPLWAEYHRLKELG